MNMPIRIDDKTASFFRLHSDATFLRHDVIVRTTKAIEQKPAITIGVTRKGSSKWLPSSVTKPTVALSAFDFTLQYIVVYMI